MNYLQLVQRLKRKCRVSGAMPVTLQNTQNEEVNRLSDWINEAWMAIQRQRTDWRWMRTSMSFTTVEGQASYTLAQIGITDFGNWATDTFRNYATSAGIQSEIFMDYLAYDVWRNSYQFGALRNSKSRPIQFTYDPVFSVGLGPVPVEGYTVIGDYYRVATELSADADTPAMPSQFHMAIVYRAMMFYGVSEASPEVYQEGKDEFQKLLGDISKQQLSHFEFGPALV